MFRAARSAQVEAGEKRFLFPISDRIFLSQRQKIVHPLYNLNNENVDQPNKATNKKKILPSLYLSPPDKKFCTGKNAKPTMKLASPTVKNCQ